ncbi:hypothetical protein BDA96_10G051900 [Sorghum bicolor]|jgi:hypothetical protein|uniref:Uncharacterized protein n=1 Tax=Sorghum bicolor TaxID=4558 RepID=A0A921Q1Z6_SORBI|nr:hypothetical protein BDA96_10G051900 [Sorghum bicolor]
MVQWWTGGWLHGLGGSLCITGLAAEIACSLVEQWESGLRAFDRGKHAEVKRSAAETREPGLAWRAPPSLGFAGATATESCF